MIKIKPFKAVVYNQAKVKDLAKVVCPPYDVISPAKQQYFHTLSTYNLIHILLGKNVPGEDKYKRAADYFRDWLKSKILIQEENPAIYFYTQQYNLKGEKRLRLGFIGLLNLNSSIFGHEHTHLEPKEDRLKLLKAVKVNLSPIFVLFPDRKRIIQRTYQQCQARVPFIDITDEDNVVHKLWRIDSQDTLNNIQSSMSGENIFIADGHHRYEVACAYKKERKRRLKSGDEEAGFNYILTYFTNTESRGLVILPIHRLVKLDSGLTATDLVLRFSEYFDVEEVKDKARFFFLMEKGGQEHVLGMYKDKAYWLLRLKNVKILDKMIADKSGEYRALDVSILNYLVLKNALGLDLDDKERLTFSPNANELIESVDNHPSWIAFFLKPVNTKPIISLALNNEKMPPKTTYFYPKVLSGLVMHRFNEDKS